MSFDVLEDVRCVSVLFISLLVLNFNASELKLIIVEFSFSASVLMD